MKMYNSKTGQECEVGKDQVDVFKKAGWGFKKTSPKAGEESTETPGNPNPKAADKK